MRVAREEVGAGIWTGNTKRGERLARQIVAGMGTAGGNPLVEEAKTKKTITLSSFRIEQAML